MEGEPESGRSCFWWTEQHGPRWEVGLIGALWLISQIVEVWYVVSPPSDPVSCYWFIFWSIFKQFSFSRILIIRNISSAGLGLNYLLWPLDQSKFMPAEQSGAHWLLCCLHNFCYSLQSMPCPEGWLWKATIFRGRRACPPPLRALRERVGERKICSNFILSYSILCMQ